MLKSLIVHAHAELAAWERDLDWRLDDAAGSEGWCAKRAQDRSPGNTSI